MMTRSAFAVLAGLALIAAAGCSTVEVRTKARVFDDTVETYAKLLRWGSYEEAASFHVPRAGALEPVDFARLKEVRITSLDIKDKALDTDKMEGSVQFTIELYNSYKSVLGSLSVRQVWWYDQQADAWHVDGQFPPLPR